MASRYVRNLVRTWAGRMGVPFYDTVNREQNPTDPVWATVAFLASTAETSDLCRGRDESGTIQIWFFGQAGVGDDPLLAQAETAMATFMAETDPAHKLTLLGMTPPQEAQERDEFALIFEVDFVYYP